MAAEGRAARERDAAAARPILEEEARSFQAALHVLRAGDPLGPLRAALSTMAEKELEGLAATLERMDPADAAKVRRAMHRLTKKIMHPPQSALTEALRQGKEEELLRALDQLFGIRREGSDTSSSQDKHGVRR
jgi:glutamyl-tRNA reductase